MALGLHAACENILAVLFLPSQLMQKINTSLQVLQLFAYIMSIISDTINSIRI